MTYEERMRRYLLGGGSPEERVDLENRYLSDASLFERLTETENDLIDSYVRGELSDFDRQEFELRYSKPAQQRARVQFASALDEISHEPREAASVHRSAFGQSLRFLFSHSSPKLRWGLAASAVVMVLAIGWLKTTRDRSLHASFSSPQNSTHQLPFTPTQRAIPAQNRPNTGGTEIARMETPELAEFTMKLTPGISRSVGAQAKTFALPKARRIDLQLALDNDDFPAYAAALETVEGKVIQRVGGLKSRMLGGKKVIDLPIASYLIQSGDYVVTLKGISAENGEEEVEVYSFRVSR